MHVSKLNSGFQKLLSSMVRAEASSLPRGLAHTVSRASSHDRNMQSIPAFLMSKYEKCKSPGLSQGLAGNPENAFTSIMPWMQSFAFSALFSLDLSPFKTSPNPAIEYRLFLNKKNALGRVHHTLLFPLVLKKYEYWSCERKSGARTYKEHAQATGRWSMLFLLTSCKKLPKIACSFRKVLETKWILEPIIISFHIFVLFGY